MRDYLLGVRGDEIVDLKARIYDIALTESGAPRPPEERDKVRGFVFSFLYLSIAYILLFIIAYQGAQSPDTDTRI